MSSASARAAAEVSVPTSALIHSIRDHQGIASPRGRPVRETERTSNPLVTSSLQSRWPRKPLPPNTTQMPALDMLCKVRWLFRACKKCRFDCPDFSGPVGGRHETESRFNLLRPERVYFQHVD